MECGNKKETVKGRNGEAHARHRFYYRAFGLTIGSSLELPELLEEEPLPLPDVLIRQGPVPRALENPKTTGVRFQARPDQFLLTVDRVARYHVSAGNRVLVDPAPGVSERELRLFLLGSVFGALLHQRGLLPFHAGAIEAGDKCVVFCGASGTGKSTIVKAFMKRGYHLHSDDICVISINKDGIPLVFPGLPQLKLWEDTLIKTGESATPYNRVRRVLDKFAVPAGDYFNNRPLPLKKIYVLHPHNEREIECSAVTGMEKFNVLKNHTYRFRFIEGLETEVPHFKTAAVIGNHVPMSRVRRPRKPFLLDELADCLEQDFRGLGDGSPGRDS